MTLSGYLSSIVDIVDHGNGYYDVPLFQPDHDLQAHKSSFTDSMYWKTSYLYICASERRRLFSLLIFFLLIFITLYIFLLQVRIVGPFQGY